ncbi:MAG TPA: xanthine dehydrogenase family protein subunit M [Ktedonobacterales bacterium]|nr:xanthine dehydrogenase family protein subunit M [Ktedonobacterales bacterium]
MFPSEFEYHRAQSIHEAIELLGKHDNAKLLAGGHSLLPMMKLRLAQPSMLIDISHISGLSGIKADNGSISIGALTTHYQAESSDVLKKSCALIPEVEQDIGDVQVRNRGTIGGNLAHADPASDLPAVMLALGAEVRVVGPKGERTITADNFFVDMLTTALDTNEVLTEVRVPALKPGQGSAYVKHPHPASHYAVVGVAAIVTRDAAGNCTGCRVGITGAGPKAVRASATEAALTGKPLTPENIAEAASHAADGMDFLSDAYASEAYRRHLVQVYTRRALTTAAERAKG